MKRTQVTVIPCRTILNPTGGYLGEGFTHTVNLYRGCALGRTLCGMYCYAQWTPFQLRGRSWGSFLDVKDGVEAAYREQYDRIKRPRSGQPKPLRLFMSSVTEPYPPQERTARRTRRLLQEMLSRPPDSLVIQSHTPLVVEDVSLLRDLHRHCRLQVNITVETDYPQLPKPFPRQAFSPRVRIEAMKALRDAGLRTVATVSPLLPLRDPCRFAQELADASDGVILDHYLLGDGSPRGYRTNQTPLPRLLNELGLGEWTTLEKFDEVVQIFQRVFGQTHRVGVSKKGFNTGDFDPAVIVKSLAR